MNLTEKNMKKIIRLIIFTGITLWCVLNYNVFFNAVGYVLKLLTPVILGFGIAFIINVPMRQIERKIFKVEKRKNKKLFRILSLVISILLIISILSLILFLVIPEVVEAILSIGKILPSNLDFIDDIVIKLEKAYPDLKNILNNVDVQSIISTTFSSASNVVTFVINLLTSFVSKMFMIFIGFILSLYILIDKENLVRQFKKLINAICNDKITEKIIKVAKLTNVTFSNFITGQCLDACLTATILFVVLSIFKIPYALIIAVLFAITALIPYIGAFIALVVGSLLIAVVSPVKALWYIVIFFIVQQFDDNFTYPRIVGKQVGLPAIWALVAALIGGSISGFVGMIIGIPCASVLYVLLKDFVNDRIKNKNNIDKDN